MIISAYSRQTRSAMGGELDHKERVTVEISDGVRKKVVHINRLQRQIQYTTRDNYL